VRDLWFKDAVIYCVEVEAYKDSNGDGMGDFRGLTERLPYIAGLGFNTIWLLPFYPSPMRDEGYDITDFYGVDSRLGTLGDFVDFTHQASDYGIRVIVDLVVNHTSDQHPWFKSARSSPKSPHRDFYVWKKTKPKDANTGMVFPGTQKTTWTFDKRAKEYYFHRFYDFQPDLNIENAEVQDEICKTIGLWLQLGVSGFRVDAAPFLIELKGIESAETPDPFQYLREFRDFLSWRQGDAILLAEANVAPEKVMDYVGTGEKLHMLFNFMLNQQMFLALARKQGAPIKDGLMLPPKLPDACQWATFLRNHDEIDLGRLTASQRQEVFREMGPQKTMQLYDRGIRRRLAPMLGGDVERLKMAYSLLFSLPGTPVIRYGEEIGMGDDLSLQERNSIRTPMQWTTDKNAGFSSADPKKLFRPIISGGQFGYEKVNVAAQQKDSKSLLNFIERCIRARKQCPEFGWGTWSSVDTADPAVFAHSITWRGKTILAVHNLGEQPAELEVDVSDQTAERASDILGAQQDVPIKRGKINLELGPYDHRWFRLCGECL
jgi:maltose alpha-D-glucosyltransferase / alpha-amylase